jgi:uncharacterized RDD family membrane protein YckC
MVDIQGIGGLPHPVHDARFYRGVPMRRLLAFLIDSMATLLIGVFVALLFGLVTFGVGFVVMLPVMGGTGIAYRVLSLARWSATPGMLMTGIELRRRDGHLFEVGDALVHTLLFALLTMTGFLLILSAVFMVIGPMGRGLHDMVLGTTAINRPA